MRADATSGQNESRLLQGRLPTRRLPRSQVRFPRLYVSATAIAQKEWVRRLVQSGGQRQSTQVDPANCPTLDTPRTQRQDAGLSGADVQQPYPGLDQLLWPFLQVGALSRPAPHRPHLGTMGASEVQVPQTPQATNASLVGARCAPAARSVRSLEPSVWA